MRRSIPAVAILGMIATSNGALAYAPDSDVAFEPEVPGTDIVVDRPLTRAANGVAPRELGFATESDINPLLGVTLLIPDVSDVFVAIFDNMGVPVTSYSHTYTMSELWEMERIADGRWRLNVEWNGHAANGIPAPNGVYIWKIVVKSRNGETIETTKKLGLR